jgi:phosphoribosyl 1,2-cyclic phosphodiesterase
VKLRFLGTRGEIDLRSPQHRLHSSLLVVYRRTSLMIDFGLDWLERPPGLEPRALLLTHAHPDHAGGLRRGAPWPVYATEETWRAITRYPIAHRELVPPRRPFAIGGVEIEAFPLEHSLRAPAVGYRLAAGKASVFYAPDVASILDRSEALVGLDLYVGDGAGIRRSILRRRDGTLIGHASISVQLDWCKLEGVLRATFTHCGSQIVAGDEHAVEATVEALGRERGVRAAIAHDGMEVALP